MPENTPDYSAMKPEEYAKLYPCWVFNKNGKSVLCQTHEDEAPYLEAGWQKTPYLPEDIVVEALDDIDELRADAIDLGIPVDRRWGVARLKEEITKKQQEA